MLQVNHECLYSSKTLAIADSTRYSDMLTLNLFYTLVASACDYLVPMKDDKGTMKFQRICIYVEKPTNVSASNLHGPIPVSSVLLTLLRLKGTIFSLYNNILPNIKFGQVQIFKSNLRRSCP